MPCSKKLWERRYTSRSRKLDTHMVENSHIAVQLHLQCDNPHFNQRGLCLDIGVAPTEPRSPSASVHVCERLHLGSRNTFLHCLHNMRITAPTYAVSKHQPGLKPGQVTGVFLWVYCSISHKSNSAIVQRKGPTLPAHTSWSSYQHTSRYSVLLKHSFKTAWKPPITNKLHCG